MKLNNLKLTYLLHHPEANSKLVDRAGAKLNRYANEAHGNLGMYRETHGLDAVYAKLHEFVTAAKS